MKHQVGNELNLRAQNAIVRILLRESTEQVEYPFVRSSDEIDALTPRSLLRRLRCAAGEAAVGDKTIRGLLMLQKNCGQLTTVEIMTWIGLKAHVEPHTCVCRTCGRSLR